MGACRKLLITTLLIAPALYSADLREIIAAVRAEVRPEEAMSQMRQVYASDRWFTFPKFEQTTRHLAELMKQAGLSDVEIGGAPADGVSQFGFWTQPLAWDVKSATLEIVDSQLPANERVLADYLKAPASLGMWSGGTPPEGVTAELIEITERDGAAIAKMDLRGRIALMPNPQNIKWALVKARAVGAVNTFTENPALEHGRQWINSWGDHGWGFIRSSTPLLSFSISPRQTAFVRRLLAERGRVKVKALVDARHYAGTYPYVSGAIPGRGSAQEVLVLGHTAEQGAQDNATGVAAMLQAAATLERLIRSGKLAPPARTIRILLMPEMYGSLHYVAAHRDRMKRTVAAMCLDTPAASYDLAGTEYTFYMNPHATPTWVDALILKIAELYFPLVKRPWHEHAYMPGTDTYLSDPTIGVPTAWAYSGSGVQTHHNSEDTPDRVDPRSLRDLSIVTAAYLYYVAAAGERDVDWLAEVTLRRGYEQVIAAASSGLEQVLRADAVAHALYGARERVRYVADRERRAIASISRLASAADSRLALLSAELDKFERDQLERLQRAAERKARAPVQAVPPAPDSRIRTATGLVVKRKRFGTIPLDDLPVEQREGYPSGAWASLPIAALYWCDGRRPLDEVIRLTRLERGPDDFDYAGYFRFLARHGYVEIEER
ncbi:MAG TPA: M28 family peptidase [Bryobacteraceae bacterium]|nr:M28 family peptidase [Bryobacteraceae bacterium]